MGKEPVFYMGRSVIAHPFGRFLAEGGPEEEILYATLDQSDLLEERTFFPVYAERRPEIYGALTE